MEAVFVSAAVVAVALVGWALLTAIVRRRHYQQYLKGRRPHPD